MSEISRKSHWQRLLYQMSSSSSSLPFIPKPLKYLCLFILLVNFRSWPFIWHIRVFSPLIRIRLTQLRNTLLLKSKAEKQAYLKSLTSVGDHPLEKTVVWKDWASPADCDWNMHLSNSSYPKTLDAARFKAALAYVSFYLKQGGTIALGGTHFNFIREIPIGSPYEVRLRLACWDDKWFYVIGQYVIPRPSAQNQKSPPTPTELSASVAEAFKSKKGSDIAGTGIPNLTGTPASPEVSTPGVSSTPPRKTAVTLEDGSIVACTSISLLCFKYGRSTVPPALALAVSGFLLSQDEFRSVSRMSGAGVSIRGKPAPNELKELLKGGWREVVAKHQHQQSESELLADGSEGKVTIGEGVWWNEVMRRRGVQKVVEERLKTFGRVREGMTVAKELSTEWL